MSSEEIIINEEVKNYVVDKIQEQGYFSVDDLTKDFEDSKTVMSDLKKTDNYKIISIKKKEIYLHKSLTLPTFKDLPDTIKNKLIEEGYSKRTKPTCNALDVLENVGVNGIPKTLESRINNPIFVDIIKYVNEKLDKYK